MFYFVLVNSLTNVFCNHDTRMQNGSKSFTIMASNNGRYNGSLVLFTWLMIASIYLLTSFQGAQLK